MAETTTSPDLRALIGKWTLDASKSTVALTTKAMWILPVRATISASEGSGVVGEDGSVSGTMVIDAASINTKSKKRDVHLQSEDFFEVSKFPTFVVNVLGATRTSSGAYELDATLTIRGQERPVRLPASVVVNDGAATVTVETEIDRSEWGITWSKMGAGLRNQIVVSARFTKA
jgi:polyisoprenoid-binding protein YceI